RLWCDRVRYRERAAPALGVEDLAQLDGEFRGMALEAPVRGGEDDGFGSEPRGQSQPAVVGQLSPRGVTNRGDDPRRAGLQGVKVGFVGGDGEEIAPEPELHVP